MEVQAYEIDVAKDVGLQQKGIIFTYEHTSGTCISCWIY